MRKVLIVLLLIAAVFYVFTERYAFVSGTAKDGGYKLVMVNRTSGGVTNLWGK